MNDTDIDAVIIWVDGSDPALQAKQALYFKRETASENASATRYASCDEILYCVGSLLRFAPFLRKIHIVTDAQIPNIFTRLTEVFGAEAVAKIEMVDHKAIFVGYEEYLPMFNSPGIETLLHRIPGLAEQFITLNDDFFLVRPMQPQDFFRDGLPILRGHLSLNLKERLRRWRKQRSANRHPETADNLTARNKENQLHASRLAGLRWRSFEVDHTPRAQRRSILETFEQQHPDLMRQNLRHRLRHWARFNPAALAAALEIRLDNRNVEQTSLVYIDLRAKRNAHGYLTRKLAEIDQQNARFLCVQSLDQTEAAVQTDLFAWLEHRILHNI